jgi:hypothetical protein
VVGDSVNLGILGPNLSSREGLLFAVRIVKVDAARDDGANENTGTEPVNDNETRRSRI